MLLPGRNAHSMHRASGNKSYDFRKNHCRGKKRENNDFNN